MNIEAMCRDTLYTERRFVNPKFGSFTAKSCECVIGSLVVEQTHWGFLTEKRSIIRPVFLGECFSKLEVMVMPYPCDVWTMNQCYVSYIHEDGFVYLCVSQTDLLPLIGEDSLVVF